MCLFFLSILIILESLTIFVYDNSIKELDWPQILH